MTHEENPEGEYFISTSVCACLCYAIIMTRKSAKLKAEILGFLLLALALPAENHGLEVGTAS
jgi:hypothetical protein